jgi:hypothetical protein
LPNFFAEWPPERLASAGLIASRVRSGVAEIVTRLRSEGVRRLPPIEQVTPDIDTPDGFGFVPQHVALLLMLWLDVSLAGRSGKEIAAGLPMLGAVGWERGRSVLLVGDASQPDILAGDTLRRAFLSRSKAEPAAEPAEEAIAKHRLAPAVGADDDDFEPPANAIERHQLPGWNGFHEYAYVASHPSPRPKRRAGRPAGPTFIQTRDEVEKAYLELWTRQGRRPYWSEVAAQLGVDERTLLRGRRSLGIDSREIRQPPE